MLFILIFTYIGIKLYKVFVLFFKLEKLIDSFLCLCVCVGGVIKSPRIGKSFLQKPKCQGGMALPNFLFYYWVTNIQKVVYWDSDWNSKSIPV